ncbi:MAG: PAS domain-containing protein [Sedimentisphaerales bacterium]|nr:PAS domain-containing protein [Sedimentisphaerales bacterium]
MAAEKKTGSNKCITDLRNKAKHGLRLEKLSIKNMSEEDVFKTVHELRIHQIELEMQNEELRKAQIELEESRNQYADLFDFAPVGYFVLDKKGSISQVNLTGSSIVGIERQVLLGKPFAICIDNNEDKDIFYLNRHEVFKTAASKQCDLKMLCKGKGQFYAELLIEPLFDSEGETVHCRVAVIDISNRKIVKKLIDYHDQLRRLSSELSLSEERVRRQVAIDVHDNIAQNLAIAKMKLESLSSSSVSFQDNGALDEIRALIRSTIENIRSLTSELGVPVLYEFGFVRAVEWLTDNIQKKHGLSTEFKDDGLSKPLAHDVQVLLFRAVRELLVNIVKHANAKHVTVTITRLNNHIQVKIRDNGVGFDTLKPHNYKNGSSGFGLFSIYESLDYVGAKLEIKSALGKGTTAVLKAPLDIENVVNKK